MSITTGLVKKANKQVNGDEAYSIRLGAESRIDVNWWRSWTEFCCLCASHDIVSWKILVTWKNTSLMSLLNNHCLFLARGSWKGITKVILPCSSKILPHAISVLDRGHLLQTVLWCQDACNAYVKYITDHYPNDSIIVFDGLILVLQSLTSRDVSDPGLPLKILHWTCYHRTP